MDVATVFQSDELTGGSRRKIPDDIFIWRGGIIPFPT
jgi:hypothetical protein